jgi:uncharacterized protein YhaN
MRFESIILERFGIFENANLDFGDGKGLHVIYGANEAGKSTTLAGLSDLLFGIEDRTPFKFRFDYGKLRIGARIARSNGERLEFKRRKARTGTLVSLSQQETTLPDAALAPFLGAADRNLFQLMFGLDQERLRSGGKQMLNPQGDFAHALFAAGTGLESVTAILSELDQELKRLGSLVDRRLKGEIWAAIDRFTGALSSKKADMIVADHYHAATKARDDATTERLGSNEQLKKRRERRNFLERGRRVAPTLAALKKLRDDLAEYDAVPALPENFAETFKKADDDARYASEAVARNSADIAELTQKLESGPMIGPIIGFEETINALCERLGSYLGNEADIPKLARRIVECDEQIQTTLRALSLDDDPAHIDALLPSKITFAKVRDLIKNGAVIRSELSTAKSDHEDAKAALADAEAALENLPPVIDATEPAELLNQVAKLGDVTKMLAAAKADGDAAELALSEALGRLGLWSGTADELAALSLPDATAVDRSEHHRVAAQQNINALDKKIEETQREALQIEAELAGLAAAGEVPSSKAIRDARDERDERWRWIRSRFVQPHEASIELLSGTADPDLVGNYETNVRHADELVDRREAEAQRVAQYTTLTASQTKIAKSLIDLEAQRDALEQEILRLDSEWHELWKGTAVTIRSPAEMAKWLARKEEVIRLLGDARRAAGKLQEAQTTTACARSLLEKAAQVLSLEQPAQELKELDRQLRQSLSKLQTAATDKSAATTKVKTVRERVQKTKNIVERVAAAEEKWLAAWREAVVELHLPLAAGTAEAEAALEMWETVTAPLTKRKEDQRRHKGLSEDVALFRVDVETLFSRLGKGSWTVAPIEKIVRDLKAELDAAKSAFQESANLQSRIDALQTALETSKEQQRSANFVIDGMRRTYGLALEDDVYDLARRSNQRRALTTQIEGRLKELAKAGDALDEATLRSEVDSVSADQANAELDAIKVEEDLLISRIQSFVKAETDAEHNLAALGAKKGAAFADQEARNAALAAAGHIERRLRLEVARRLLERSVRRYQDENQNPMITRASELFARIASTNANPIERISIDYRDAARPVPIGWRHDGSECGLDGLSEATRDQLFLSLRVAAIERFCEDNEPLPFVADDLFMTSDEQRVLPLLQILAELGRTTQVIAFTHHQHVIEIAKTLPKDQVRIHTMPAPAQFPKIEPPAASSAKEFALESVA